MFCLSVVISYFNALRSHVGPYKAHALLVVNADAVLTCPITNKIAGSDSTQMRRFDASIRLRVAEEAIGPGVVPHCSVAGPVQSDMLDVYRFGKNVRQPACKKWREILVEQQLHAYATSWLRSRSAAYARQAWMSSRVR